MKRILHILFILAALLPSVAFGTECRAPKLVEDVIVEIDGSILQYQKEINAQGNICTTMVRKDASLEEVYNAQMRSLENSSMASMINFLGDIAQPQDFLDDFLSAVPFFDRPYALTFDLDRIQLRLDRLWDLQIRAHSFCQVERAAMIRTEWANYFETMRWIRHAGEPLYNTQPNPFYVGFAPDAPEYSKYAATGFYHHPEQLACSDGELNLEQIGSKLEKVYDSLTNAVEEVDHEFKQEIKGVEDTWKEVDRLSNELNNSINTLFMRTTEEKPKKTMEEVLTDLEAAKGESLSTREFLNQYTFYEQQYETNRDISGIREEIEAIYQDNSHVALRIEEQELDNMVRTLLQIDSNLGKNIESLQQLCEIQAKDIPCPPISSLYR